MSNSSLSDPDPVTYQTTPETLWTAHGAISSGQLYTALTTLLHAETAYRLSGGNPDYWDDLAAERARFETVLSERARQMAEGK